MAFQFITICEGIEIPTSDSMIFKALQQTNLTYSLCSNPQTVPIKFSVSVKTEGGSMMTLIPMRSVPNTGTDMCNELKGLILNENSELYIQASAKGLYFKAAGFTLS